MKRTRALWWLVLSVALSACSLTSTRLAGWYATRQIDGYLDLTSAQKERIRPEVDAEVDRARREDLPHWLNLLRWIRETVEQGPTEERVLAIQRRYDELLDAGVARLAPKFAPLLAELNDEQLTHFQQRLLEFVDKQLPEQKLPVEERRAEQDERNIDAIEKIAGDLSDEQETKLLTRMHETPDDRSLRYQNDRKRTFAFIKFLKTKPGASAIEAELKRLWVTRFDALGPGFDLVSRRALQRKQLIALHGLLTPEQRAHAVEHLTEQIVMVKRWVLPASS
jgi:Family of unknown function (DUF6279)